MQISKNIYPQNISKNSIETTHLNSKNANDAGFSKILTATENQKMDVRQNQVPAWVNKDYHYDPSNPRKPNMRELMEALSGMSLTELYADPNSGWQELSKYASEVLYGVTSGHNDSRDWDLIMNSENIPAEIKKETNSMHQPTVEIVSETAENDNTKTQHAVIKDKSNRILRALSGDSITIQETLENFGASSRSIPLDIEQKISDPAFDPEILSALNDFRDNNDLVSISSIRNDMIAKSINKSLSELTILENNS